MWRSPRTGFARRRKYEDGGELLVRMANKAFWPGYWQAEKATESKFVQNVFEKGDLYYRVGDALRRDQDGLWYFIDRLGTQQFASDFHHGLLHIHRGYVSLERGECFYY